MSQNIFSTIDPAISGTDLATTLDDFKEAIVSGMSGTSRPTELDPGGGWIDMTNDPVSWDYKIWTGTSDVTVFTINLSSSIASVALAVEDFSIKKISEDTAGSILKLVKQRIATNGQVLDGDVVGEIRFVGRADDASNPVVAKMIWTASDNMTTSAYGGELAFWSTPDGSATLTKHLSLANGIVEAVTPHKLNSLRLVSQNVATAATIAQLSADFTVVEMTGSTATDIQGIKSDDDSQVVTIHNRSTANVTLKHQNGSATAADRMKLPGSADYVIIPEASATLYYCTADTRWKLKSTADKNFLGFTVETFYGANNTWTAPSSVSSVKVRAYKKYVGMNAEDVSLLDSYGNAYAWGINTNGQLGIGSVTAQSSPVAVLGSLTFLKKTGVTGAASSRYGLANTGALYAWGVNTNGQLGLGDVTPRSSPVAVLGSLRFNAMFARDASAWALSTNNLAYAWGVNSNGQLGLGDVTPRSSPVAVSGGLRWSKLVPISGATGAGCVAGITTSGVAYAWGINTNGNLGVGDTTPRSSPVAIVGGVNFSDFNGGSVSSRYFFAGLNTAGAAYAWGDNSAGQLGTGDTIPRSSPVAVVGGLTFGQVITHAKSESVFGLTSSGVLYAWGDNTQGVLGVGDTTNRSSPVAVLGGLTFSRVVLFRNSAFGIAADGTAYAWGANANGQLGVGDVVSRSSPVAVLGGLKFMDIVPGDGPTDQYSFFGVSADGALYAWGANTNGTLGLGDVIPRSSPVAVLGAFRPDTSETTYSASLTVTPSTAYTVSLNSGISTFGNTPLGLGVYKVEVEYLP